MERGIRGGERGEEEEEEKHEEEEEAPNDTAYKQWSCHSGYKLLYKLCRTLPPPAMGARFTVFWGKPAMRTRWIAGAAPHKSG